MNNQPGIINLKIGTEKRAELKRISREHGMTMQSVLLALIDVYLKNPNDLIVTINFKETKNNGMGN